MVESLQRLTRLPCGAPPPPPASPSPHFHHPVIAAVRDVEVAGGIHRHTLGVGEAGEGQLGLGARPAASFTTRGALSALLVVRGRGRIAIRRFKPLPVVAVTKERPVGSPDVEVRCTRQLGEPRCRGCGMGRARRADRRLIDAPCGGNRAAATHRHKQWCDVVQSDSHRGTLSLDAWFQSTPRGPPRLGSVST